MAQETAQSAEVEAEPAADAPPPGEVETAVVPLTEDVVDDGDAETPAVETAAAEDAEADVQADQPAAEPVDAAAEGDASVSEEPAAADEAVSEESVSDEEGAQEAAPDTAAADEMAEAEAADQTAGDDLASGEAGADSLGPDGALESGDALPPDGLDPSMLDPEAVEAVSRFQPLYDLVEAGGPIIVILAALSVITLALVLVKLVQFTILRVGDGGFVSGVVERLRAGDMDAAFNQVQHRPGVIARVMEAAVRGLRMNAEEARVREEVTRVAQSKLDGLERGLPLLSLIATLSPLLGLLGTVLGMIDAFQQMQDAGDRVDPAILSGGIWEALLTTAAGLSVAIPAAAFYGWLQRAVDVASQRMEDAATQVFTASLYRSEPEPAAPEAVAA